MKRVNISLRQSVMTVALLACITASAYDFEVDGFYYDVLSMSDLTCAVTSGDNKYTGEVNIPEQVTCNKRTFSVTSIGDYAFMGCSNLTSVTIGNSVTSIGHDAFIGCSTLASVTIPNSVTTIGNHSFTGCTSLETLIIEDGSSVLDLGYNAYSSISTGEGLFCDCPLKSVYLGRNIIWTSREYGYSPFYNNTTLTSVTIGDSVTTIGSSAFSGCKGLTSVTIGDSVTTIGSNAFTLCEGLTGVTIPNSVTTIENYAFNGCSRLETLIIEDGSSVLDLGYNAYSGINTGEGLFYDCPLKSVYLGRNIKNETSQQCGYSPFYNNTTLTSVTIGDSVTTIGARAFSGCEGLTSVTISDSVTTIWSHAFSGCKGLTSLTIGNSVTSIENYAFEYCSSLTSVTIPNSVTTIGGGAFESCKGLTSVTIGNSVVSIGYWAFGGCKGLTSVTSLAKTPPCAYENTFPTAAYLNAMLYVPIGSLDSYRSATCWKNFLMEEKDVSGVEGVKADDNLVEKARYSLDGKMLLAPEKGVNIVKMSDGTTKKVVVK